MDAARSRVITKTAIRMMKLDAGPKGGGGEEPRERRESPALNDSNTIKNEERRMRERLALTSAGGETASRSDLKAVGKTGGKSTTRHHSTEENPRLCLRGASLRSEGLPKQKGWQGACKFSSASALNAAHVFLWSLRARHRNHRIGKGF